MRFGPENFRRLFHDEKQLNQLNRPEEEIEELREGINQYVRLIVRIAHDPEAQRRMDKLTKTTFWGPLKKD